MADVCLVDTSSLDAERSIGGLGGIFARRGEDPQVLAGAGLVPAATESVRVVAASPSVGLITASAWPGESTLPPEIELIVTPG